MGAGEIKAGGAYVEIGTDSSKLDAGLAAARDKISAFGESIAKIGGVIGAVGAAIVEPLREGVAALAEYGESIGKIATKTGASTDLLAGLKYAADSTGVSFGAIGGAMKGMAKAVQSHSTESQVAFDQLGLSAESLKTKTTDEKFLAIADALDKVADPGQKAVLAMQTLGRAGNEILPVLEGGRAAINSFVAEAKTLGLALTPEQTKQAEELHQALTRMNGAILGLKLALGAGLAEMVTAIVARITDCVIYARQWTAANEGMIASAAKIGLALAGAGAVFVALGGAIMVAMSSSFLLAAGFMAIGAALLATLDVCGVTDTGFGEMFDSIRVKGTGLGTWFGAFTTEIGALWDKLTVWLGDAWDGFVVATKTGEHYILQGMLALVDNILAGFEMMVRQVQSMFVGLAKVANLVLPKSMQINTEAMGGLVGGVGAARDKVNSLRSGSETSQAQAWKDYQDSTGARHKQSAQYQKIAADQIGGRFNADDAKGSGIENGIDTKRLKDAFEKIGGKVGEQMKALLNSLLGNIPHVAFPDRPGQPDKPDISPRGKLEFSAVGTFSGAAAGQLGASGVFNDILAAVRSTAENTAEIERQGRYADAGAVAS